MAAALATAYQLPPEEPDDPRDGMPLLEHLEELRRRLIRCCVAAAVGMFVAFFFIDAIVDFVLAPARRMLPPGAVFIYTAPTEAFSLYVNVALIAGVLFASPYIAFQVWRFIAPALYTNEKRFAIPFVALTTFGAVAGSAFAHYVLFPYMIAFFGTFSSVSLGFMPRLEDTFGLYIKMVAGMVVVFQIPTIVFFLAKMGMVTAGWLWRNVKYAILAIFIAAAVLTPSADPWNQTLFAAPMVCLYVSSIGIAWLVQPRR